MSHSSTQDYRYCRAILPRAAKERKNDIICRLDIDFFLLSPFQSIEFSPSNLELFVWNLRAILGPAILPSFIYNMVAPSLCTFWKTTVHALFSAYPIRAISLLQFGGRLQGNFLQMSRLKLMEQV